MIKNYCDICGDEIKGGSLYGGLMRQRKIYPMGNNLEAINTSQVMPEAIDLCQNCILKVWDFVETLKPKEAKQDESKKTL